MSPDALEGSEDGGAHAAQPRSEGDCADLRKETVATDAMFGVRIRSLPSPPILSVTRHCAEAEMCNKSRPPPLNPHFIQVEKDAGGGCCKTDIINAAGSLPVGRSLRSPCTVECWHRSDVARQPV